MDQDRMTGSAANCAADAARDANEGERWLEREDAVPVFFQCSDVPCCAGGDIGWVDCCDTDRALAMLSARW